MLEKISFKSGSNHLVGNLFLPQKHHKVGVLMLHGGGEATKERYLSLQQSLELLGMISLSFDFQGIGESEGEFAEGSLNNRLLDAEAGFKKLTEYVDKIIVVAGSMAGHIAVRLTQKVKVEGLFLLYPAAYSLEAEDKKLGKQFSQIIRQEDSFIDSPVFRILKDYKNPVFILIGEKDQIIPEKVKKNYKSTLKKTDQFIVIPNLGHVLLKEAADLVFKYLKQFLGIVE